MNERRVLDPGGKKGFYALILPLSGRRYVPYKHAATVGFLCVFLVPFECGFIKKSR